MGRRVLPLAFTVLGGGMAHAQTDITALVLGLPGVPEAIARICEQACMGNETRSWLERAELLPGFTLRFELRLQNRHVPFEGVVLYDDTARVTATATVAPLSCQVTDWSIDTNNDLYRAALPFFTDEIEEELTQIEGQCREFLGG